MSRPRYMSRAVRVRSAPARDPRYCTRDTRDTACIARNKNGPWTGHEVVTSKIHALVDTNGLPIPLKLTAGEPRDKLAAS